MTAPHVGHAIDLESLVDLEQRFYQVGFDDGLGHGKIHGRIEGGQLGREKGFEVWEELGFYEGFARLLKTLSERGESKDSRLEHAAILLLNLIAQFPTVNPSHADNVDIPKLFGQIRARYKMLCSIFGSKPSLRASRAHAVTTAGAVDESAAIKRVGKNAVWTVATDQDPGSVDYSF